ncbi:MAG: PAS domain-containing sensor histidine kinase [Candidatus Micrarchaeia archaeon]
MSNPSPEVNASVQKAFLEVAVPPNMSEEERLTRWSIIELSPTAVVIFNTKDQIIYVNAKFCQVMGYEKNELLGRSHTILEAQSQSDETLAEMRRQLSSGKPWVGEFQNLRKDGTKIWIHAIVTPFVDAQKHPIAYVKMCEDFTERKRAYELLHEEKRKVEELSAAKDEFLRSFTHELNTPLSIILTNLVFLRGRIHEDADALQSLDLIERSSQRLRTDIDHILQLAKLENQILDKKIVPVAALLEDICKEHAPLAKAAGLQLREDLKGLGQASVLGDGVLLRTALANFVSNAIKFTLKGEVSVQADADASFVRIGITDTGIGISPTNLSRLFSTFPRIDVNLPGNRVGLILAKGIIEKHNGRVEVKSEEGKGSLFTIILPRGDKP